MSEINSDFNVCMFKQDCMARGVELAIQKDKIRQLEQELVNVSEQLAEAKKDQARLDWLESQCVEVRTPLPHGSLARFHAQQISDDCEPYQTDLRVQVDSAIKESK